MYFSINKFINICDYKWLNCILKFCFFINLISGACENETNPCSSNGICLQISSTQFICQCKPEYTGILCQISLFSSSMNNYNTCQCLNGGICLNNGTCSCLNGYIGTRCDMSKRNKDNNIQKIFLFYLVNSCLSNPCNQGTCHVSTNCVGKVCGYSCLCSNGTSGLNCEIGSNPCWSNPCQNNGSCSVSSTNYICQCRTPYAGTNCDLIINVCTPNPCLNNGNCIRDSNIKDGMYRCEYCKE